MEKLMKEITIYQANNPPIKLLDDDNTSVSDFTKKISSVLEAGNVTILETASGNVVIRPHKIDSIHIHDTTNIDVQTKPVEQIDPSEPEIIEQPPIDEEIGRAHV